MQSDEKTFIVGVVWKWKSSPKGGSDLGRVAFEVESSQFKFNRDWKLLDELEESENRKIRFCEMYVGQAAVVVSSYSYRNNVKEKNSFSRSCQFSPPSENRD